MTRRLAARLTGVVAAAAGAGMVLTGPAAAAPTPAAAPSPQLVQAMHRDLGLTPQQAAKRLAQQTHAAVLRDQLRDALGGAYGGSYFDAGSGKLVVGVTDAARLAQARAAGADARIVQHSARQLRRVAGALTAHAAQSPREVTSWGVEPRSNSVVLHVLPGATGAARSFAAASGVQPGSVRIVESPEKPHTFAAPAPQAPAPTQAEVVGGNPYTIGTSARCSIGFAVQGGFVSAGHCGDKGDSTSGPTGTFANSVFPGHDYSWVRTDATTTPRVNGYGNGDVTIAGSTEAPVGASVCRSGSTTGWHCGTVQATDQTVSYPQGDVNGLTKTDVCAEPGDSGGSFVAGDQAQGTTSGGSGDCSSGGTTYFQPVKPALQAFGLKLVTG